MNADAESKLLLLETMVSDDARYMTRHIQSLIRDDLAAEDLQQDALLRAVRGLAGFRGRVEQAGMCPWLDQIARHLAYNYLRDHRRLPWQESLDEQTDEGESLA
jgi:DNA-directed RNA polymerase specialized sigma24 family protein